MSLLKHCLTTSGGSHGTRACTHTRTHICGAPHEAVKIPPSPSLTSETMGESRLLNLNGPIMAAASERLRPASHNELNDLFRCTHSCHSNPVSHSASKHDYCHSESRVGKCLPLVIYATCFPFVCMRGCVCLYLLPLAAVSLCFSLPLI